MSGQQVKQIELEELEPENEAHVKFTSFIMFTGKRGVGKTTAMRTMAIDLAKRGLKRGIVVVGSEGAAKDFKKIFLDVFIHVGWDPDFMENVINQQEKLVLERETLREMDPSDPDYDLYAERRKELENIDMYVWIDDLGFNKKFMSCPVLKRLAMNGRQYLITVGLNCQYPRNLPPDVRSQLDLLLAFKEVSRKNRDRLYEDFFDTVDSASQFSELMKECTVDRTCLVMDGKSLGSEVHENLKYYRADASRIEEMAKKGEKIATPEMIRFHEEMYLNPLIKLRKMMDKKRARLLAAQQKAETTGYNRDTSYEGDDQYDPALDDTDGDDDDEDEEETRRSVSQPSIKSRAPRKQPSAKQKSRTTGTGKGVRTKSKGRAPSHGDSDSKRIVLRKKSPVMPTHSAAESPAPSLVGATPKGGAVAPNATIDPFSLVNTSNLSSSSFSSFTSSSATPTDALFAGWDSISAPVATRSILAPSVESPVAPPSHSHSHSNSHSNSHSQGQGHGH